MLQMCFLRGSNKILLSSVCISPQGHVEQMRECLHCQGILKVHLERHTHTEKNPNKPTTTRTAEGKFRQLSAYSRVKDKENSSQEPFDLILLAPSHPVTFFRGETIRVRSHLQKRHLRKLKF